MNKSTIFKSAHKQAREIVSIVGDYRLAFQFALKEIYAMKNKKPFTKELLLVDMGLDVWVGGSHRRIYINKNEHFEAIFGLKIQTYKHGGVKSATLNGEKISNNKAFKILCQKHYYDCNTETFVSSLTPII